jgi:hypothetical protein
MEANERDVERADLVRKKICCRANRATSAGEKSA